METPLASLMRTLIAVGIDLLQRLADFLPAVWRFVSAEGRAGQIGDVRCPQPVFCPCHHAVLGESLRRAAGRQRTRGGT